MVLPPLVFSMALRQALVSSMRSSTTLRATFQTFLRARPIAIIPPQLYVASIFHLPVTSPLAIQPSVSSIFSELWDSILRAVPKKKTSHRKKRARFLAGKALKDVTNLNTCSACGEVKRAHLLCPYCVASMPHWPPKIKDFALTTLQRLGVHGLIRSQVWNH